MMGTCALSVGGLGKLGPRGVATSREGPWKVTPAERKLCMGSRLLPELQKYVKRSAVWLFTVLLGH